MDLNYDNLRPLDAVCTASTSIPARLIRLWSAHLKGFNGLKEMFNLKIANHAGLIVQLEKKYWIAEMVATGLQINSLKTYLKSSRERIVTIRRLFAFADEQTNAYANAEVINMADATVKYDYKGLLQFLGICPDSPSYMYCSELCEIIANHYGSTWDQNQLIGRSGKKARIAPVEIQFGKRGFEVKDWLKK
ncbi:MAG TPA: YiiX/YebB-like N1pC/P60 family cysteine hydrolase [Chitinispirillaceae bacterium]|nr:YiiX/YebB-like N1pC/P60 family cysteine hydrolase [Chitinispirillaceae bacterium]